MKPNLAKATGPIAPFNVLGRSLQVERISPSGDEIVLGTG